VSVFHDQHAAVSDVWHAFVSGDYLLLVGVSAIVQDDVYVAYFGEEILPKSRIALISNMDFEPVLFPFLGSRIQIDSDYSCLGAKIFAPHEQRAAVVDADFRKHNCFVSVPAEEFIVGLKVRGMLDR
jgi:hypothetical protein